MINQFGIIQKGAWVVLLFLVGCTQGSFFQDIIVIEDSNVLRKTISFTTSENGNCYVEYWRLNADKVQYSKPSQNSREHDIKIINLLENQQYQFRIISNNNKKIYKSEVNSFTTKDLPIEVPRYEIEKKDFSFDDYILLKNYKKHGCFVLLDDSARVVWYELYDRPILRAFHWTNDNHIVSLHDSTKILEFDLYGEVHNSIDIREKGMQTRMHHELFKNLDGDYVFLKYDYRYLNLSAIGGKLQDTIRTDGIVVINNKGELKWEWSVFDELDPLKEKDIIVVKNDWGHANSISYSQDGNFIVSFRDFNQIWKINSDNGKVIWKLGSGGDFALSDSLATIKQHSAHFTESGELMAFDNGDIDRGYSRVVSYELNEENLTLKIRMNIPLEKKMSTFRMGSAYYFDAEHILVCSPKKILGLAIYTGTGEPVWKVTSGDDSFRAYLVTSASIEEKKPF